jgi:hypothetical protein
MKVKMKKSLVLLLTARLSLVSATTASAEEMNEDNVAGTTIITRDVVIIGGGVAGTYAALRLKDHGKSVVVIEAKDKLGGHTETYHDQETGKIVEMGVQWYHDLPIVHDYFKRFDIPLTPMKDDPSDVGTGRTMYMDFSTGKVVPGYSPPVYADHLAKYVHELEKYPYLRNGFNLPDPVPADLLLPFKEFVKKYNIRDAVDLIFETCPGHANFMNEPTLYIMKCFGPEIVKDLSSGFLTTKNNHLLYEKALAALGSDVLLSTKVVNVDRTSSEDYAEITVQTGSTRKTISAKQIIYTIPPYPLNVNAVGYDFTPEEIGLFIKFQASGYITALVKNIGIPSGFSITNVGLNTLYNLPKLPGIYKVTDTSVSGLMTVNYASLITPEDKYVQAEIIAELKRIWPKAEPEFIAYSNHAPVALQVSAEDIKDGFYKKLRDLQGKRRMWFTGAAFHTHDAVLLWEFIEGLLPKVLKALDGEVVGTKQD